MKMQVHHDTAPSRGQVNSFDLVRVHLYGHLDKDIAPDLPITERPSFQAMVAFALDQPEVRRQQVIAELDDVTAADGDRDTGRSSAVAGEPSKQENRFRVIPARDFTGGKPLDWIVKSLLPRAQVGVIYGQSTAGKSFATLDIAAHVSQGVPWRGLKTRKGRVVIVIAEGAAGYKMRMQAYTQVSGASMDDMPDVLADAPDLKDPQHAAWIALAIGTADLVIIDTLAASFTGNENSGEDLGLVLRHCKFIHEKTGAMVWLVHHSGKDETKGARGWSGLKAACDVEMEVTAKGHLRKLALTKLKDGDADREWGFQLRAIVLGTDADGDAISSCVVEASEIPEAAHGVPEPTSKWQQRVLKTARRIGKDAPLRKADLIEAVLKEIPEEEATNLKNNRRSITRAVDDLLYLEQWLFRQGHLVSLTRAVEAGEEFDE